MENDGNEKKELSEESWFRDMETVAKQIDDGKVECTKCLRDYVNTLAICPFCMEPNAGVQRKYPENIITDDEVNRQSALPPEKQDGAASADGVSGDSDAALASTGHSGEQKRFSTNVRSSFGKFLRKIHIGNEQPAPPRQDDKTEEAAHLLADKENETAPDTDMKNSNMKGPREGDVFECPLCGTSVDHDTKSCPNKKCGALFE